MRQRGLTTRPGQALACALVLAAGSLTGVAARAQIFKANPTSAPPVTAARSAASAPGASGTPGNPLLRRLVDTATPMDSAQEAALGREMVLTVLTDHALVNDISLQTYVNELGRWISLESTQPDLPWTFGVLDSSSVAAYAAPGGHVFITRGLLDRMGTEAELASLLAHEIAYVTDRHVLKALARQATANPRATLPALVRELYAQGLDADSQFAADRSAVMLATRTGFNPHALANAIKLASPRGAETTVLSALLGPDAMTRQRLSQLKQFMGTRFDGVGPKSSPRIGERLAQLNLPLEKPSLWP